MKWKSVLLFALGAVGCFHLAFTISHGGFFILGFFLCLFRLSDLSTDRKAFYIGLLIGLAVYAPQLWFFWTIFHATALALWLVLPFWLGLFLALAQSTRRKLVAVPSAFLIPILWTGLEYFRSELYNLRFSWLSIGYAFSSGELEKLRNGFGLYGVGLLIALFAALFQNPRRNLKWIALVAFVAALSCVPLLRSRSQPIRTLQLTGVQLEFPIKRQVLLALDDAHQQFPLTDIFVFSEYTFDGPVPSEVKDWCRDRKKYLIVGGKDFVGDGKQYYNTAFVVGTNGEVVFQQAKSVPIQFFNDGLPAKDQRLWQSPWGRIGLCICYDLSYRRVVDNLVAKGAQLLIVPTMDVADWGEQQHELHARVAPTRAIEYGVPIFRLCSSGISQAVDKHGRIIASAPFPGQNTMMSAEIEVQNAGKLPLDHWLAPIATGITGLFVIWLVLDHLRAALIARKR